VCEQLQASLTVHVSRVMRFLYSSPAELHKGEQEHHRGKECAWRGKVLELASLKPGHLSCWAAQASAVQQVREQDASSAKHGPATILQLSLLVPVGGNKQTINP